MILIFVPVLIGMFWALATGRFSPKPKDAIRINGFYAFATAAILGALGKFGPQAIELTPASLRYRAGRGPFRIRRAIAWDCIGQIEVPGTSGSPVTVVCTRGRHAGPIGLASNLMPHAAPILAKILQQYQAAALRTPAVNS